MLTTTPESADHAEAREQDRVAPVPHQHGLVAGCTSRLAPPEASRAARRHAEADTFSDHGDPIQRFRGPVLPDGEVRDLYVVDGRITLEPQAGAETVAEGWIVPGLVDAHCHIGLDDHGAGRRRGGRGAGGRGPRRRGAADPRRRLGRRHPLDPRPRRPAAADPLRAAPGPHQALHPQLRRRDRARRARRRGRARGARRATAGSSSSATGSPARRATSPRRSRPRRSPAAIAAAHEHGARVTAHCFGATVLPGLIEAGIDCIEHGTGLDRGAGRRDGRARHRAGADRHAARQVPRVRRGGRRALPGVRRAHDRPATRAAGRRSWRPTTPASRSTPAPTAAGSAGTATSPARWSRWPSSACRRSTRSAPRRGAPASGSAGTPPSTRAPRPTSSSTTATRATDLSVLHSPARVVLRGAVVA